MDQSAYVTTRRENRLVAVVTVALTAWVVIVGTLIVCLTGLIVGQAVASWCGL